MDRNAPIPIRRQDARRELSFLRCVREGKTVVIRRFNDRIKRKKSRRVRASMGARGKT